MTSLPVNLYCAEQVRALDRCAIEQFEIPGIRLMQRAGEAAFRLLLSKWPQATSITLLCGSGNNGGDGYIVAGLARRQGIDVQLFAVKPVDDLTGDARQAALWAQEQGVNVHLYSGSETGFEGDVIVDALLGTGLNGPVKEPYRQLIDQINACGLPVLSIDIPSGLCSDTGAILGTAVEAQLTISFIGLKQGCLTGAGPAQCGELVFDDLAVPAEVYSGKVPGALRMDYSQLSSMLRPRRADAHKGDHGRLLVVGGSQGMGGAGILAAEAALRGGAGLVTLATHPDHVAPALARCPALMVVGIESGQQLEPWLENPDLILVGPGLGQSAWSDQMLNAVMRSDKPLVVDADALNLIARGQSWRRSGYDSVITPHPGEAARLLNSDIKSVQSDRFAAVRLLARRFEAVAVLKGAGSLVAGQSDPVRLCNAGNPGMATAGMGDVLGGVISSLMVQGLTAEQAATLGVCVHAMAGDLASQQGQRGLMAFDLLPYLRQLLNPQA